MGEPVTTAPPAVPAATGLRARMRRTPGGGLLLRVLVFLAGLFFVLLGLVLIVLPGPLTIPPILLGVWLWSTEFAWAHRLLEHARASARIAWEQAKRRPVWSALATVSGLVAFGIGVYLTGRYDLLDRARELVGL